MSHENLDSLFVVVDVEIRLFLNYCYFPTNCQLDKNITSVKSKNN